MSLIQEICTQCEKLIFNCFDLDFSDESFNAVGTPQPTKQQNSLVPVPHSSGTGALTIPQKKTPSMAKPKWHAPWKLYRVIAGHLGWVRCCAVEPGNEWFATGSADRVIKVINVKKSKFYLKCLPC